MSDGMGLAYHSCDKKKRIGKDLCSLKDVLMYGISAVVIVFLLKKLPWAAAPIVFGLLFGTNPSADSYLWMKIFFGSLLMVGIIVVANDNVEISSDPAAKQTLTRVGNLYNQLTQDTAPRFTLDELHRIEQALTERNLPPKKYPMNDYREELRGVVSAYKRLLNLPAEMCEIEKEIYPPNCKSAPPGSASK